MKRINLSITEQQQNAIVEAAQSRGTSMVDIIRQCIRVGLLLYQAQSDPDAKVIIRQGSQEREVILA